MDNVVTTYLEMTSAEQLRPKRSSSARFQILEATARQWEFNRFLYVLVGKQWAWVNRLAWSDEQWKAYVARQDVRTFVGYLDGSPAGYFELSGEGDVEIAYFGLAPDFIGQGLGGPLLTAAIEKAWRPGTHRVWVHTCTADHPAALSNYQARGMVVYKVEPPGHA